MAALVEAFIGEKFEVGGVLGVYPPRDFALLAFGAEPLSRALGAHGEVLDHATTYLSISAIGVPFFLVTLAAQGVFRGAADYTTPLWVLVASNVANFVIELVLVFGLDMGVAGSALSTVIAQIGGALAFMWLLRARLAPATIRRAG